MSKVYVCYYTEYHYYECNGNSEPQAVFVNEQDAITWTVDNSVPVYESLKDTDYACLELNATPD